MRSILPSVGQKNRRLQSASINSQQEEIRQHSFLSDEIAEVNAAADASLDTSLTRMAEIEAGEFDDSIGKCTRCGDSAALWPSTFGRVCVRCTAEMKINAERADITPMMQRAMEELDRQGKCCERAEHNLPCMCTALAELDVTGMSGTVEDFGETVRKEGHTWRNGQTEPVEIEDEIKCPDCKEDIEDCTCYETSCEYCGVDYPGCDCCPTGKHSEGFLSEECDCMTEEEKFNRLTELEENMARRKEKMFGFLSDNEENKDVKVSPDKTNVAEIFAPLSLGNWCSEHNVFKIQCKDRTHVWWCNKHDQVMSNCKGLYHEPVKDPHIHGFISDGLQKSQAESGKWSATGCKEEFPIKDDGRVNANLPQQSQMFSSDTTMPPQTTSIPLPPAETKGRWTTTPVTMQSERHDHPPTPAITGPDGAWGVWCGKRTDVEGNTDEFDLIINLTGHSIFDDRKHTIPIESMKHWSNGPKHAPEMILDWPDYSIINWPLEFWLELMGYIEENDLDVVVFCFGGHGRTGTMVAAMMIVSLNFTVKEAVGWLRKNYCHKAVESKSQVEYLYSLEDAMVIHNEKQKEAEKESAKKVITK